VTPSIRILLDECVPRPFRRELPNYNVRTVPEMGWSGITNGKLLRLAEQQFDVFITIDKNMQHQQNLASSTMAIIVLNCLSNRIDDLLPFGPAVLAALETIQPGALVVLS